MNILFVYYIPSGGVETLNRQRCLALREAGINAHCLYYQWGAGMQNAGDLPIFVTSNDITIKQILDAGKYDVVIVTTDHQTFPRFRMMGYRGKFILEIQGYGPQRVAWEKLTEAAPIINSHVSGLLNPKTPHISTIFQTLYPHIPQFQFNNCFDASSFTYQSLPKLPNPVIAWIGRIEDNKNWREFLQVGASIAAIRPEVQLWMFEDPSLANPVEREAFTQMIGTLNLSNRLTIRANVPNAEMQQVFSKIGDSGGMLISTSKVEGAPYGILEAMSCRCPVLSTSSDGVSSSIYHNETGKFYSLGNIEHAVKEALELMYHVGLREHIRTHAQRHVLAEFNPSLYTSRFVNMLSVI
ncbi:glycosyltransferase family 4 protein [Paenibacillus aurantiacus]|uniref:Glycosyltransferase family 4 protein n=1 Tax=Paenibacillus aurantiacus TaxID=1936118 RepID=A0ABV5KWQ6_9BACL